MFENLERILGDIHKANNAGIYYAALAVSLTLPQICVGLTFDNSTEVKGQHYKDFLNQYAPTKIGLNLGVSADDCWKLRCGLLHRGNASQNRDFNSTHVIFTVPESKSAIHGISMIAPFSGTEDAAMIDLITFCNAMETATRSWMSQHTNHPNVIRNEPNLLSMRPLGVAPFVGMPVVACGK